MKMRWEAGACAPPRMQAIARGSWKPQPPCPGGGPRFSLAVATAVGGLRCLAGDPREADPSSLPRGAGPSILSREAGLANDPREVGRATLGTAHGLPSVLCFFLLLVRSPGHRGRGNIRSFLHARLGALDIRWCCGCGGRGTQSTGCPWKVRADLCLTWCPILLRARQPPCASHPWP